MVGAAETKERERARRDRENFMLLEVAKGSVEVYGGYRDERERGQSAPGRLLEEERKESEYKGGETS